MRLPARESAWRRETGSVADGSGTIFIPYRDVEPVLAGAKDAGGYERALRQRFAEGDDPVEARESMRYDELGKAA